MIEGTVQLAAIKVTTINGGNIKEGASC